MSFYTSNIRTDLVDPIVDVTNNRTEFRLVRDNLYLSNLRLVNLGLVTSDPSGSDYNHLVGAMGAINRIEILDGATQLDMVDQFGILQGFRKYNKSNEDNKDLSGSLNKNLLGFINDCEVSPNDDTRVRLYKEQLQAQNDENSTGKGWLDLQEVFPMLRSLQYLHCGIFKNLKVVVEYVRNKKVAVVDPTVQVSTIQPLLVADNVLNQELAMQVMKNFKGIAYPSMEVERIIAPEMTTAGTQNIVQKLQGFNGKTLNKMILSKNASILYDVPPADEHSTVFKNIASESMYKEKLNVRVNGANKFARNGVIGVNERLGLLHQTFGTCNTIPGANMPSLIDADNKYDEPTDYVGHLDYFAWDMAGEKVSELELNYSRDYVAGEDRYNQQLDLNCFGECVKQIVRNGDGYLVQYL